VPRARGYFVERHPDRPPVEEDTFTCGHCNRVVFVPAKCSPTDLGGLCSCCSKLICPSCVGRGCDPMEEKMARWETRRSIFECS
jgi:hypothetical protein